MSEVLITAAAAGELAILVRYGVGFLSNAWKAWKGTSERTASEKAKRSVELKTPQELIDDIQKILLEANSGLFEASRSGDIEPNVYTYITGQVMNQKVSEYVNNPDILNDQTALRTLHWIVMDLEIADKPEQITAFIAAFEAWISVQELKSQHRDGGTGDMLRELMNAKQNPDSLREEISDRLQNSGNLITLPEDQIQNALVASLSVEQNAQMYNSWLELRRVLLQPTRGEMYDAAQEGYTAGQENIAKLRRLIKEAAGYNDKYAKKTSLAAQGDRDNALWQNLPVILELAGLMYDPKTKTGLAGEGEEEARGRAKKFADAAIRAARDLVKISPETPMNDLADGAFYEGRGHTIIAGAETDKSKALEQLIRARGRFSMALEIYEDIVKFAKEDLVKAKADYNKEEMDIFTQEIKHFSGRVQATKIELKNVNDAVEKLTKELKKSQPKQ